MADLFNIDKERRISELSALVARYQDSYYSGEGEISDAEFDALWDELKELDPENPVLKKVGAEKPSAGVFPKARHRMMMGSQEKASNPEEFLKWAETHAYDEYLVEYKLDGASLELQYDAGTLVRAVTRGDGEVGDEITANARKMRGVPSELFAPDGKKVGFTGAVRGEVIMTRDVHARLYADKANCRNAANGLMKRKDGSGSENLTLVVYDALAADADGNALEGPFSDEVEKVGWLRSVGFSTVRLEIRRSAREVIDYRAEVDAMRPSLDYDIDGLVVKERRIDLADARRARPDRQIAFKFSLEEAATVLRGVEWSESGATYTPVGIFDEVKLNGTTVQRASLANPGTMRRLGVKIGSRVVVVKRGEIIPKIVAVLEGGENPREIEIPEKCASCSSGLVCEDTRLYCPNPECPKKILHRLQKWISVIDIRDFGDTLVRSLFSDGKIRSISDIYALTADDLTPYFLDGDSIEKKKDSLGARKVFDSIQSHRKVPLAAFVAGFDIEGVGETVVQKLVDAGFDTLEKLLSGTAEEFAAVYGFAEIMAETVVRGLSENAVEMRNLVSQNIVRIPESDSGSALSGKSFCFTGELRSMKRADAESLVKSLGGTCKSSVTKDLSFLVTNDPGSGSSKNAKAAKYGVKIITEEEFLRMSGK